MPEPGDLIEAFSPQPGRCFRMAHSRELQAEHCREVPAWKGVWRDRTENSWYVKACRRHAPKVNSAASEVSRRLPRPVPAEWESVWDCRVMAHLLTCEPIMESTGNTRGLWGGVLTEAQVVVRPARDSLGRKIPDGTVSHRDSDDTHLRLHGSKSQPRGTC